MLILKCTLKVSKELGLKRQDLPKIPKETEPTLLGEWFVNALKFGRQKVLLFTNADTLYSFLVPYKKKDLADIGDLFRTHLQGYLQAERLDPAQIDAILQDYAIITLAQTDSRSVLGSMNDMVSLYTGWIENQGGIYATDLTWACLEVNRTPQLKRGGAYSINLLQAKLKSKELNP